VSDRSDVNAKIRDQLLDIKALQQIDTHRLELWLPVTKAGFPLTASELDRTFRDWGLEPPALAVQARTPAEFLDDVVRPQSSLTVVNVAKQRYGFAIDDCLVEIADLTLDGTPLRTIAVEMADPDRVWRTVNTLGLSGYENVNYVKTLKRFLAAHTRSARQPAPGRARL
jgi:hypothetical protein